MKSGFAATVSTITPKQTADGRRDVNGQDRRAWIAASKAFRHCALATADFQDSRSGWSPRNHAIDERIEIDEDAPVRFSDRSLERTERASYRAA